MPAKPRPAADILAELEETIAVVRVRETRLIAADSHLHGLCDYGTHTLHVDPRPAVLETLVHEALHYRNPSWSERRVDRESGRLVANMTDADVRHWWRLYRRLVRASRRPLHVDEDD